MENKAMVGTVIKTVGGIYYVMHSGNILECSIRKTAKKIRLVVGDKAKFVPNEFSKDKYIIVGVETRKNAIPRPPIANLDKLLILISPRPEPDLMLVDKLIIYSYLNDIEPIIVIGKSDIASDKFVDDIKSQYGFLKVFEVSALNGTGMGDVEKYIAGSFVALAGQSAVGKSSFINALIPNKNLEIGGLSRKIDRGKHTTRVNEIYLNKDYMIADTTGFSSLDLELDHLELAGFYPEFEPYLGKCKYLNCSHIKEGKDCLIVSMVDSGKISKERYERYISLYNTLKKKWEEKYD